MNVRPRKSWWTIRLRTLLLLILLIGCALGWLTHVRREGESRRALANLVNRPDSMFEFEYRDFWGRKTDEPPPAWQQRLLGEYYFRRITGAEFNEHSYLSDNGRRLSELHDLQSMRFVGAAWGFQDQHAEALAHLRRLKSVSFAGTRLSDQGLANLSPENPLRELDLSRTLVTDAGLAHLSQFATLESLDLSKTLVTDEGMKQLAGFPCLKELTLGSVMVSTEGVRELAKCQSLESLSLAELPLWPEAFATLAHAPRLQSLAVGNFQFFDGQAIQAMRDDKLIQEQAVFALGPPNLSWAIDDEEHCATPYLRWLLEHGADPNNWTRDIPPLHWFVGQDALDVVQVLLEYGAEVDQTNHQGKSALTLAALEGQKDMVHLLLVGGANPNIGAGIMMMRGQVEIVRDLIDHGADVNRADSHNGFTPLHSAASGGHVEIVRLLLKHGADPAAKTKDGETASSLARRGVVPGRPVSDELISLLPP